MFTKRHLLKLDYLFYIVLVCSEPQQVFKYMEYLKSLFYNHILKCYSNKVNETRCNSLLIIYTIEPYILQKKYVSTQEIRPECKVFELRYRPIGTTFFIQEYNLLFPIPKKNVIFNIHHLLFQTQYFFLINSSNLMDKLKQ